MPATAPRATRHDTLRPRRRARLHRSQHALALAAVAAAVAGCSGSGADQPAPAPSATATGRAPAAGTPKPLDISWAAQRPCDLLVPAQDALDPTQAGLFGNGVPAKPATAGGAPACAWTSGATLIVYLPGADETTVYRTKGAQFPVVVPLAPIEGYPLAAYGNDQPLGSHGECRVALSVNNRQAVVVWLTQPASNPGTCDTARGVMTKIVGNLRARAR
ncbi:DUF3558 domain-containing protein [Amycolatopsis rubida]|uniref:DUF3558 domain-containing protein n=1 Tax=Amycolatopsis rubida TaxID=112413 RepID=A0ABX0BWI7_9PSEU|nr:DUF3558 family protein [Amycolatopsis sp. M39]MYW94968.1 DUF3558 domain-containing protein [Amycolatopsis rubida]NEC59955.1 DUF3558 domain-containing protein [Amycolatopsis rubida]OAP19943.1 hypothetical protein A4R44_09314 [Amycolatopsis sp. M39]